jgi:hypothetical protein
MKSQVFTIVPASNGPFWLLAGIVVMMVVLVAIFVWLTVSSKNVRFEVSENGLNIAGVMYGRNIPRASLVADGVRVLNLHRDREYGLRWRTNGAGLPGFSAGWFKLRNGEKSLCFVTDSHRVVYVPTTEGYSVLISVPEPEAFKTALVNAIR